MDLRVQLIQEHTEGQSISALAEIYDISRKTIYKWLARYDADGVAGLVERSRVPRHSPSHSATTSSSASSPRASAGAGGRGSCA